MKVKDVFSPSGFRPYRLVSHPLLGGVLKQKFIFIHINKCGGSSVSKAIWPKHKWHDSCAEVIEMVGEEAFRNTFSFTVVRNPWAKVFSQYQYRIRSGQNKLDTHPIPFSEWVQKTFGSDKDPFYYDYPKMFQSQLDWLKNSEGKVIVNTILRFENLSTEFESVRQKLGIRKALPHRNKTKPLNYVEHYDQVSRELIGAVFSEDIAEFGYVFGA